MANTIIQLKRSSATAAPASLAFAEPAYSFNADKLLIGNTTGHVHTIGGKYYTDLIDAATDSNTFSTIVRRDSAGIFSATALRGNLYGNANTATIWQTTRYVNLSGDVDAVSSAINGSANVDLTLELTNTGVTAASYGSGTNIPIIVVDADGRITFAANVAAAASGSFGVDADSGSAIVDSGETLEFIGGDGITTSVADVTPGANVTIDVDSTVVRTTGNQTIAGNKTFSGDDTVISGNLVVSGQTFYANTTHLEIGDNIIQLNRDLWGNVAPSENAGVDINRGSSANVALRWNEGSDYWELTEDGTNYKRIFHDAYANATSLSTGTVPSARVAGSYTGITGVGTLTAGVWNGTAITVPYGGTGMAVYAVGDLVFANTTTTLSRLADIATGNALLSGGVGVAPAWGKIGLTTHVSGTLAVGNGGTGAASFTENGIIFGNTTGALGVTAAGTEGQLLQANASGVPVFGDLDGGTF